MNDTTPEVARLVRELCARKTGAERLRMGTSMFETARTLVLASLPPGLPEWEMRRRLCARFYGELADRVYGSQEGKSFGRGAKKGVRNRFEMTPPLFRHRNGI